MALIESDEEKTKSENEQFRVVSHTTKSNLENVCDIIRNNADLARLKTIDFNRLTREEKNIVEESIYTMMAKSRLLHLNWITLYLRS